MRHSRQVKLLFCSWRSFPTPFPTAIIVLDVPAASRRARLKNGRKSRSGLIFLQFGIFWDISQNFGNSQIDT